MAIKIKSGEIKVGTEYFARGAVVTGIDQKDEEKLISLGAAEYAPEPEEAPSAQGAESGTGDPPADPAADGGKKGK